MDDVAPAASATVDEVRAYWDRRPCNIRHSEKEVGTRGYFDDVEARKYLVEPHIPGFADFERWRGKRVLEIGCGIGTDSINFARAGADVTVVDLSPNSLELCKRRFDVYGLTARFYCGDSEVLEQIVPVEPYDLIYSFGVIHHTPRPKAVIERIKQYCEPGTEVRVMVYSRWSWKVIAMILGPGKGAFWRAGDLIRRYSEAQFGSPVTFVYSTKEVRNLLSGFKVERIWKDHIFPYAIADYVEYRYRFVWYFRLLPRGVFRWLEHRLGWHTMAIARWEG